MKTCLSSVALMVLCTFFTSLAQVFYKLGAPALKPDFFALLANYYVIIGILLYAGGAAILIVALRGGDVSILYPIVATSFIWVSLMSMRFFGEPMNIYKWLGVFVIIAGIIFINIAGKEPAAAFPEPV